MPTDVSDALQGQRLSFIQFEGDCTERFYGTLSPSCHGMENEHCEVQMKTLSNISLKIKVPAVIAGLCIVAALVVGINSYFQFRSTLLKLKSEQFEQTLEAQSAVLQTWMTGLENNVAQLASSPFAAETIKNFSDAWKDIGDQPSRTLQELYIHSNPNPVGEKHRLMRASDNSFYSIVHEDIHPYYSDVVKRYNYYDLFLFDASGDLVYSTFKEPDFATNFENGIYANSGLGEAFRTARTTLPGSVSFVDYSPYAPSGDAPAAFLSAPVQAPSGDLLGVLAIQLSSTEVQRLLDRQVGTQVDRTFIVGDDGLLRSSLEGFENYQILSEITLAPEISAFSDQVSRVHADVQGLDGTRVMAASQNLSFLGTIWRLVAEGNRSKILAPLHAMQNLMILGGIFAVFIFMGIGWLFSKSITRPIAMLENDLTNMSGRNYDTPVSGLDRSDEFGHMAGALEGLRESLARGAQLDAEAKRKAVEQTEVVEKLTAALRALSEGDLTCELHEPFTVELESLRGNFNNSLTNLRQLVGEVITNCDSISSESHEISREADNLSQRTENQAATLEQTAAALDQLTSGVKQAAESAKEAESIVNDTRESAQKGKAVVDEAVFAMSKIEESSNQISEIIGVIDEIAFQTNLLALNAGVEAGRAGEAGRGFAVVASEVGSLSKRSSDAAKEIKKLIADSARQVSRGVEEVTGAGEAITAVVGRVSNISELMHDIASSAVEQSHSLDEINIGVNQLDQVTQQNAAMVEQSTAASHQLNSKADHLGRLVGQFRTGHGRTEQSRNAQISDWEDDAALDTEQTFKSARRAPNQAVASGGEAMWQNF